VKRKLPVCRITLHSLLRFSYVLCASLSFPLSNVTGIISNLKLINAGRNVLPQYKPIVLQTSCV